MPDNFSAVAKVPVQEFPKPVTPLQQTTLLSYAAVAWLGSSACALVEPDIRQITVPEQPAAVVTEQESVPA